MCTYDGMNQHYLFFVYIGRWIRKIFHSIVTEHRLSIPMFDIGIGYGSDILTSLSTHILDPFNWISAFIPEKYTEQAYTCVIMAKLYLSGLSFAFLCRKRNLAWRNVFIGTVVYVFAASSYIFPLWAYFLNVLYIYPLVIVGMDDLWKKKTSKLFLCSFLLVFINCFYFAYMVVILGILYCISNLIFDKSFWNDGKKIAKQILKYLFHGMVAVGLSMPILLPVILLMARSKRIGADFYLPALYSMDYYKKWITGFTSSYMMSDRDCYIGYATIALICVISLFLQKKRYGKLKLEFIVLTAGMLIPAFGSVMNGFSYYANRWVFAYTLLIAVIVAEILPELKTMEWKQKGILTVAVGIYIGILAATNDFRYIRETIALLVIILLFVIASSKIPWNLFYIVTTIFTLVGVWIPARYHFSKNYENALRANTPRGEAYETVTNAGAMPLLREVDAEPEERFDGSDMGTIYNETMLYGLSGMNLYLSLGESNISTFHNDIGLLTNATNSYYGLNRRSELEYLMGVSRYLITEGEEYCLPYGYSRQEFTGNSHGEDYSVYHSEREVSLLHAFSRTVSEDDWKKLDYLQRQKVLTRAIVANDGTGNTKVEDLDLDDNEISYRTEFRNVEQHGADYITSGDGSIILYPEEFSLLGNGEIYVSLEGTDYSSGDATGFAVNVYGLKDEKRTVYTEHLAGTNNKNHIYEGRHDWMMNIGYTSDKEAFDAIEINLPNGGTYHFDRIRCYVRPTKELAKSISEMKCLENSVRIEENSIAGSFKADQQGYVLLSIPYSEGWKLWIDGKRTRIDRADDAFMMFAVSEGEHEIQMKYCTPGLISGSVIAILTMVIFVFFWRKGHNKVR